MTINNKTSLLRKVTLSQDFNELRKSARLEESLMVRYCIQGKNRASKKAAIKNISLGGCLLVVTEKLSPKDVLDLNIVFNAKKTLSFEGNIVRLAHEEDGGVFQYGVFFKEPDQQAKTEFSRYCFKKMYDRVGLKNWPTQRR